MNNRSKAMYSSLAGLVVVGAIALATALGHHAPPSVSYNLSSPPPAAQQGLSTIPATSSGPAPGTSYANGDGTTTYPGTGADQGPVDWQCNPTGSGTYQVVLTENQAASGPVTVKGLTVQLWSPEGALYGTDTPAMNVQVTLGSPQTVSLTSTNPNVNVATQTDPNSGDTIYGWSCSVDSLTETGASS